MGLFDKIGSAFEKKSCSICGNEIRLLGNKKLEDGNMCKECAEKLSPFFSERRHSTVAEIEEQLAYREANKEAVAAFNLTRTLGNGRKVLLDENARKFIVSSSSKKSYEPKRWDIDYNIIVTIHVNSPYFDEIDLRVNESKIETDYSPEFRRYMDQAEEIRDILMGARAEAAAAYAPKVAKNCPHCGATCVPDANGCCEYCGGAMA